MNARQQYDRARRFVLKYAKPYLLGGIFFLPNPGLTEPNQKARKYSKEKGISVSMVDMKRSARE